MTLFNFRNSRTDDALIPAGQAGTRVPGSTAGISRDQNSEESTVPAAPLNFELTSPPSQQSSERPAGPDCPPAGRAPSFTRITRLDCQLAEAHNEPLRSPTIAEAHTAIHDALARGDEHRARIYAAYVAREIRRSQNDAFGPERHG